MKNDMTASEKIEKAMKMVEELDTKAPDYMDKVNAVSAFINEIKLQIRMEETMPALYKALHS